MMSIERQINLDNHCEIMESMELFKNQLIEIKGSLRRTDTERLEYADSIARKFQAEENAKVAAEKEQSRITQGEPSRRGDGVSTSNRSKGGGRSGGDRGGRSSSGGRGGQSGSDRGGRTSGGDRGGRSSGSGHGGRALPPFCNLLTGQEITGEGMSYEGTRFPIDP
ncbi:keratin, type II cytoskeletal 1-like [Impatiens glandulifera]|uniref:keratin, type II cytoskeletal 1-like n=1 Tax=Impatiens glandulifera TaxID=253017 RepID=UPI001FB1682B|nr:keratin, type II cytoskeletal 1-like [Impatiens glandulifera]